jgi:hypothetical protein
VTSFPDDQSNFAHGIPLSFALIASDDWATSACFVHRKRPESRRNEQLRAFPMTIPIVSIDGFATSLTNCFGLFLRSDDPTLIPTLT